MTLREQVKAVLIKHDGKKFNEEVLDLWVKWIENYPFEELIRYVKETKGLVDDNYCNMCMDVIAIKYKDILNSPLWKAMNEEE